MAYAYGNGGSGTYASSTRRGYSYGTIFSSLRTRKPKSRKKKIKKALATETSPRLECCERHAAHDRVGAETSTYERLPSGLPILRDPGVCGSQCSTNWPGDQTETPRNVNENAEGSKAPTKKTQKHATRPTGKASHARASADRQAAERRRHNRLSHESSRFNRPAHVPSSQTNPNVPPEEPTSATLKGKQKGGRGKWGCFSK